MIKIDQTVLRCNKYHYNLNIIIIISIASQEISLPHCIKKKRILSPCFILGEITHNNDHGLLLVAMFPYIYAQLVYKCTSLHISLEKDCKFSYYFVLQSSFSNFLRLWMNFLRSQSLWFNMCGPLQTQRYVMLPAQFMSGKS